MNSEANKFFLSLQSRVVRRSVLKGRLKCRNHHARCVRFENNSERSVLNNNSPYARTRMAIEEEGGQEKGLRERQASEASLTARSA